MVGPRDLSSGEIERFGLGRLVRNIKAVGTVTRLYCLRCGSQISLEGREADPERWWTCVRGCNTRFANLMDVPEKRPAP